MRRLALLVVLLCLGASGVALAASSAQTRPTSGVIWASANHSEGNTLFVSGDFKDKILGRGAIVYLTRVRAVQPGTVQVTARRVTIYTTRGAMIGKGSATQTTNPDGTATVTDGTFRLTRGTGKLKGRRLSGTFTGTLTNGIYTFRYNGTFR